MSDYKRHRNYSARDARLDDWYDAAHDAHEARCDAEEAARVETLAKQRRHPHDEFDLHPIASSAEDQERAW